MPEINNHEDLPKPEMTHGEASFHQACAGQRAAREAANTGNDPEHVAALGEASSGGKMIGGIAFQRPSIKSSYAISALTNNFSHRSISPVDSIGLFLFAFADPAQAYQLACVGKSDADFDKLLSLAQSLMLRLDNAETIETAQTWCTEAYNRLHGVKKPSSSETREPPSPDPAIDGLASPTSPVPEMGATAPAGSTASVTP